AGSHYDVYGTDTGATPYEFAYSFSFINIPVASPYSEPVQEDFSSTVYSPPDLPDLLPLDVVPLTSSLDRLDDPPDHGCTWPFTPSEGEMGSSPDDSEPAHISTQGEHLIQPKILPSPSTVISVPSATIQPRSHRQIMSIPLS
ncbi:hypothetical protein FRC08_000063, partial [Ceratobasidium sp. 394]